MEDIKLIVERLSLPPYNQTLTLVEFHAKTGEQLLQVVSDVLGELDPKHKRDIRDDPLEASVARLMEFLLVLGHDHGLTL
jgi:Intraflagellar transport 81 calponin homology domain